MPAPRRRLYTLYRTPPAWAPAAATLQQHPAAQRARTTTRPPILFEDTSPVRPYVLPPAERARMLRGGAR
ncbi:hypothetical protein [Streptomyces fradiae]|uniref:hypothetical protein n=1 Tax=Streptomyces fradiae TaxID=1906 RepID=UPI0034117B44